jgi:hypothetical protein
VVSLDGSGCSFISKVHGEQVTWSYLWYRWYTLFTWTKIMNFWLVNVISKILFQDLENYILELIPTLPQLDGLEKSFHSFYVCTAVRKFLFFLDPLRTGRVRIQDILACSFLDDLLEVCMPITATFLTPYCYHYSQCDMLSEYYTSNFSACIDTCT